MYKTYNFSNKKKSYNYTYVNTYIFSKNKEVTRSINHPWKGKKIINTKNNHKIKWEDDPFVLANPFACASIHMIWFLNIYDHKKKEKEKKNLNKSNKWKIQRSMAWLIKIRSNNNEMRDAWHGRVGRLSGPSPAATYHLSMSSSLFPHWTELNT